MQFSDQLDEIAPALHKAQTTMPHVSLNGMNPHFNSRFATLGDVMDAAKTACEANGLTILQSVNDPDPMGFTMNTTLLHISGQWVTGGVRIGIGKNDPQGWMSAVTYGRRGSLAAILGIVGEPDDDGNSAMPAPKTKAPPQKSPEQMGETKKVSNAATEYAGGTIPEQCPKCGGKVWDNSDPATKKNPKAPDWKCRDATCKLDGKFTTAGWITKAVSSGDVSGFDPDTPEPEEDDSLPF